MEIYRGGSKPVDGWQIGSLDSKNNQQTPDLAASIRGGAAPGIVWPGYRGWVKSLQTYAQDRVPSYGFLWRGILERGGFGKPSQGGAIVAVLRFGVPWCQIVSQRERVGQRMPAVSLLVEMVKVMPSRLLDNGFRSQRAVGVYLFVYLFDFHDARMLDWQGFQGIIR